MHTMQISYKGFTTVFEDETEAGLLKQVIDDFTETLEQKELEVELENWLDSFDQEEPFIEQVKERVNDLHGPCPNCGEDCVGWIVDGKQCGNVN